MTPNYTPIPKLVLTHPGRPPENLDELLDTRAGAVLSERYPAGEPELTDAVLDAVAADAEAM